jgi:hypothetical protein
LDNLHFVRLPMQNQAISMDKNIPAAEATQQSAESPSAAMRSVPMVCMTESRPASPPSLRASLTARLPRRPPNRLFTV